ncbi:AAA family ATPase, partial [Ochrobactrum sp. WV_118_8]
ARLSDEQRQAIEHITGPEQISAVVGFAGAGKSTMLAAAREAWEAEGYKVHGAALSGKAAEGLEESSGIHSRTLASWSYRWDSDRGQLNRGDVFVIDEAGMIGSRQLARFVGEAEARGAKIVLVGDHEQLQAIGAGAPFRAIAEEIGHAELSEIRRQRVDWQRAASVDFATHRTAEGLAAYHAHGDIRFSETGEGVRGQIVRDYLADRDERPEGSRVAMAHRRADVRALNADIRAALQERGELAQGNVPAVGSDAGALTFQTNDGKREFAPGDRIVFLENDRDLGVKNGMLGTVEHVAAQRPGAGPMIIATLDRGDSIAVPMDSYQAVDHGYATTIHKNQGATVDRSFVLASGTMDRHLTYVAMTRHRDEVQLYAAEDEFTKAGKLVENGAAPFEHDPKNSDSYFVTLENDQGQQRTIWGVDLERAMTEASPEIGEKIGLEHVGSTPVTLPDGTETHRNTWQVREANELAYAQLEKHLSRSGVKETTLDYASDLAERQFAERRGIAESMGVVSEIELPAERQRKSLSRSERSVPASWGRGGDIEDRDHAREDASTGRLHSFSAKDKDEDHARGSSQKPGVDLAQDLREDPHADLGKNLASERAQQERVDENSPQIDQQSPQQVERKRGGIFAGLKLTVSSGAPTAPSQASWMQPERERSLRPAPAPASPAFDRLAERVRAQSPLEVAVDRYARAYQSIAQHHADGLPILDMQRQEIRAAGKQLDQVHAGMKDLMVSTLGHDPEAARAMTALSGRERVSHVIDAMQHENAALQDPHVRADRFMNRWQELQDQQRELRGWRHDEARARIGDQLQGLAKSLERDPQVDSILRNRSRELGIRHTLSRGESVAQALQVDRSRGQSMSRGFGIEM